MTRTQRVWLAGTVVALCLVGIGVGLWIGVFGSNQGDGTVGASSSVEALLANPGQYVGRRVTVHGMVSSSLGPRTATLGGNAQQASDDLLVIGTNGKLGVFKDESVNVTGTVRRFSLQQIPQQVQTSAQLLQAFDGKPVVFASKVTRVPPNAS